MQNAQAMIAEMQSARNVIARQVRQWRAEFPKARQIPAWRRMLRHYIQTQQPPVKPTADNLFRRAMELYRYSRSSWRSRDTEYYSACGYDDYQSDLRAEARKHARELFQAYAYLKFWAP